MSARSRSRGRRDLASHVLHAPLPLGPGSLRDKLEELAARRDQEQLEAFAHLFWLPQQAQPSDDPIRVIRIVGSLFRGMFFDDYADIRESLDGALEDPNVRGVILDVDSPGGQLSGLFDLASHVLSLREHEKPIWALANDQATSAAYAIASAADEVFVTSTGIVGSIGVLVVHLDESSADDQFGLKFTEISSGARKTDLSRHKPLSSRGRAFLQEMVDRNADLFFEHVSSARGISVDAVRDQEAGMFIGEDGVEARLVDGIASLDELVERMRDSIASPMGGGSVPLGPGVARAHGGVEMDPNKPKGAEQPQPGTGAGPETPAPAAAAPTGGGTAGTGDGTGGGGGSGTGPAGRAAGGTAGGAQVIDLDTARREGAAAERERVAEIARLCRLARAPQLAAQFVEEGLTAEQVGARLLEHQVEEDERLGATRGHLSDARAGTEDRTPAFNVGKIYRRWNDPQALSRPAGEEG